MPCPSRGGKEIIISALRGVDGGRITAMIRRSETVAPVAELVDATDSKSVVCMDVPVRVGPGAPTAIRESEMPTKPNSPKEPAAVVLKER